MGDEKGKKRTTRENKVERWKRGVRGEGKWRWNGETGRKRRWGREERRQ